MRLSIFTAILLCFSSAVIAAETKTTKTTAPVPASFPAEDIWQLDIELHGKPTQLQAILPGDQEPTRFWYMVYTLTNNNPIDVDYYPTMEVMTDTFKLYEAGKVPTKPVYQEVERLYRESVPLLEPEIIVAGKILQGEDNARDCVAILDDFDPNATSIKVFISGLSNETAVVEKIDKNNEKNIKKVLLRKTLMLEYRIPGDQFNQDKKVMLFSRREWIMR